MDSRLTIAGMTSKTIRPGVGEAFAAAGQFPAIPLMEDIALSKRLKALGAPLCLRAIVTASGHRWERHGVVCMMVLMWRLRLAYFFGADPARLAALYDGACS